MYVSDQHERLRQPGEVGHLFWPPVRGRDDVNGARFDGGHPGAAAIATATADAVTEHTTDDAAATGAVHHVPGYLPGDAQQQVPRHAGALVHHHLGQGH